jgi:Catalytic LigB subunit of aromatic ring-opening dioxygenase
VQRFLATYLAAGSLSKGKIGKEVMARIVGGIATSHSPTIGFAVDHEKQHEPMWAPIFVAYEPVRRWLAEKQPDVLLVVYNDHATSFFFDHYSAFALGIGESYAAADEGGGARLASAERPRRAGAPLGHGARGRRIRFVVLSGSPA